MILRRISRWLEGVRVQGRRSRTAQLIRLARRERDIARKAGWTTEADFCQFRAGCYMLSTYFDPSL